MQLKAREQSHRVITHHTVLASSSTTVLAPLEYKWARLVRSPVFHLDGMILKIASTFSAPSISPPPYPYPLSTVSRPSGSLSSVFPSIYLSRVFRSRGLLPPLPSLSPLSPFTAASSRVSPPPARQTKVSIYTYLHLSDCFPGLDFTSESLTLVKNAKSAVEAIRFFLAYTPRRAFRAPVIPHHGSQKD